LLILIFPIHRTWKREEGIEEGIEERKRKKERKRGEISKTTQKREVVSLTLCV